MKEKVIACTVGMLLGDSWATVPALRDLCCRYDVDLVCGTYAGPAWRWAGENIAGCDWNLVRTVLDPDDHRSAFCPGFGGLAMQPALDYVRGQYPKQTVLGWQDIGTSYLYPGQPQKCAPVALRSPRGGLDGHTVLHAYTAHDWKNCEMVVEQARYSRPVAAVGLASERVNTQRGYVSDFNAICEAILFAAGFVGVLSSWANFAALFHKPQIVASFTGDVYMPPNPNRTALVTPTLQELQAEIDRRGF